MLAIYRALWQGYTRGWGRLLEDGTYDLTRHERPILFWLCMGLAVSGAIGATAGLMIMAIRLVLAYSN